MNLRGTEDAKLAGTRVLVIDDEDLLAWSIDTELKSLGAEVERAASVRQALERMGRFVPDVVVTDLRLPDGNGLELLERWHTELPDLPVILITAHGAVDSAVAALRHGAFDYLQKPFDMKQLMAAVVRAAEMASLRQKVSRLQGHEKAAAGEVRMIGDHPSILTLRQNLARIARSRADTVLIVGESGTGKELCARAVHMWSERANQPFVEINCASIPENLLESELFGYEKGAFTDARERKLGLFEMARSGTIFLDEIGELTLKLQTKLLRALEYRRFKRLGGTKDIEFSGRIVAATNRNILEEVARKTFRDDLYYRLSALTVRIPPLRDRASDIPVLVEFFLDQLAMDLGISRARVASETLDLLAQHRWPGNVRELRNTLLRALVIHEPKTLLPQHIELESLPVLDLRGEPITAATSTVSSGPQAPSPLYPAGAAAHGAWSRAGAAAHPQGDNGSGSAGFTLPTSGIDLDRVEKDFLIQALAIARHNQTKAAKLLGISRHTLRYRLEKHGLVESAAADESP